MLATHWADKAIQVLLGSRLGNKSPLTAHKLQLKIAFTGSSGNNNKTKTRRQYRKCRSAKCRRAQNEKASHVENFIRREHRLQKNSGFFPSLTCRGNLLPESTQRSISETRKTVFSCFLAKRVDTNESRRSEEEDFTSQDVTRRHNHNDDLWRCLTENSCDRFVSEAKVKQEWKLGTCYCNV